MNNPVVNPLEEKDRTDDVLLTEHCKFDSFSLKEPILQGLTEAGFHIPSPIQAKAIPLGRCGLDLIVQAKSGTGKTAVFTIIALEMVKTAIKELQVLVVAPTREIAFQIKEVITTIGKHLKDLKVGCFIGGLPIENDIQIAKDCHIAVGAPGRLNHLIKKGYLKTSSVKLLVLDEGDKLMEQSFINDINYMCNELPLHKQMIAVSATFSEELKKFLQCYMHRSTFITPKVEIPILLGLRQFVSEINSTENTLHKLKNKVQELDRLFNKISFTQCMIFCNYESQINSIKNFLKNYGWDVACISGSLSQSERLKVLGTLKDFKCRILLSTDLTARGIDATNVDVVINFDVPISADTYLHRMGRAGRYGCKGVCITITSNKKDTESLQKILGIIAGTQMSIAKLPVEDELLQDLFRCDLNKLPRLYGATNLVDVKAVSYNEVTESILEVKNFYQKKLSESDAVPYEFERMCVEAIDENINKNIQDEINKSLKSEAATQLFDDEEVNSASVYFNEETSDQFVDSDQPSIASITKWQLVKETTIEDSVPDEYDADSDADEQNNELLNNQKFNTELMAYKNISLFNLSQALRNQINNFDAAANSVTEYLKLKAIERKNNFKEMSNIFSTNNCHDVLNNLGEKREEWRNHKASKVEVKTSKNLIFKFGYDYLCKDDIHWIDGLGDNYKPIEEKSEINEEYDRNVVGYFEEDYEEIEESYGETNVFNYGETNVFNVEETMDVGQTEIRGKSNQKFVKKYRQKKKRRATTEHNSNTYSDRHWNFYQGPDKFDDYKHLGHYYDYPIKRFMKSLSKPIDSQKSEEAFKLWLEGMSEVTKYLHRGIYWNLMYHNLQ